MRSSRAKSRVKHFCYLSPSSLCIHLLISITHNDNIIFLSHIYDSIRQISHFFERRQWQMFFFLPLSLCKKSVLFFLPVMFFLLTHHEMKKLNKSLRSTESNVSIWFCAWKTKRNTKPQACNVQRTYKRRWIIIVVDLSIGEYDAKERERERETLCYYERGTQTKVNLYSLTNNDNRKWAYLCNANWHPLRLFCFCWIYA